MYPVPVRASNKGCTIRRVEIPSNKLLTTAFLGKKLKKKVDNKAIKGYNPHAKEEESWLKISIML